MGITQTRYTGKPAGSARYSGRLAHRLAEIRDSGLKALIGFVCAGDPDLPTTEEAVLEMERAGVDAVELGVPFSEPLADGPVIQRAYARALEKGISVENVMHLVARLRERTDIPLIILSYLNPILSRGADRFLREAASAGADGLIVPDVPLEESRALVRSARSAGLAFVPMVAPTATAERVRAITRIAEHLIYLVTVTGVTGKRGQGRGVTARWEEEVAGVPELAGLIRRETSVSVVAGFGISSPSQAASLKPYVDGVVVGSAIVEALHGPGGIRAASRIIRDVRKCL